MDAENLLIPYRFLASVNAHLPVLHCVFLYFLMLVQANTQISAVPRQTTVIPIDAIGTSSTNIVMHGPPDNAIIARPENSALRNSPLKSIMSACHG